MRLLYRLHIPPGEGEEELSLASEVGYVLMKCVKVRGS